VSLQLTNFDRFGIHSEDSESFGMCMEGLRALQEFTRETERRRPDRDTLNETLDEALKWLGRCESMFPTDYLPLYSLGLALTMKNQLEYAAMLYNRAAEIGARSRELKRQITAQREIIREQEKVIRDPRTTPYEYRAAQQALDQASREVERPQPELDGLWLGAPEPQTWPLLVRARRLFRAVESDGPEMLSAPARFNWAHVQSRLEGNRHLREARDALLVVIEVQNTALAAPRPVQSVRWWRRFWGESGRSPEQDEDRRVEHVTTLLLARVLVESVEARMIMRGILDQPEGVLPLPAAMYARMQQAIEDATIPPASRNDLEADLETKVGYLYYQMALQAERPINDWLTLAEAHLRNALSKKSNWNPAQIYMAQVHQARGEFDPADALLTSVLGFEKPAEPKHSEKPGPTSAAVVDEDATEAGAE
jgi:hypothetical protein